MFVRDSILSIARRFHIFRVRYGIVFKPSIHDHIFELSDISPNYFFRTSETEHDFT